MKEPELLPCPFCWKPATIKQDVRYPRSGRYEGKAVTAYEPVCTNPFCIIYMADNKYFLSKRKAAEAWNDRDQK